MTSKNIYWFYAYLALLFVFVIGLFTTIRFEGKDIIIGLLFAGLISFMTLAIGLDISYKKLKSEKKEMIN